MIGSSKQENISIVVLSDIEITDCHDKNISLHVQANVNIRIRNVNELKIFGEEVNSLEV